MDALRKRLTDKQDELNARTQEVNDLKPLIIQVEKEKEMRAFHEIREEAERRERIAANAQLMAIQTECTLKIQELENRSKHEIDQLLNEQVAWKSKEKEYIEAQHKKDDEMTSVQSQMQQLREEVEHASTNHEALEKLGRVTGELEVAKKNLREIHESQENMILLDSQKVLEYEEKIREGETQRRKLHNLVQELRGNVRVFARVRPFLPNDTAQDPTRALDPTIQVNNTTNSLRIHRPAEGSTRAEDHSFTFDKSFGPSSSQESLFEEVSEFVQSALDGYNVCLFSYGQTGSGKVS